MTIKRPLKNTTVKKDDKVVLECELSKPGVKVEWLKGGKPFKPDENVEVKVDGAVHKLILKKTQPGDAGAFTLKIPTAETTGKLTVQGTNASLSYVFLKYMWIHTHVFFLFKLKPVVCSRGHLMT